MKIFNNPFKHKCIKRVEFDNYIKESLLPDVIDLATGEYERLINKLESSIYEIDQAKIDITSELHDAENKERLAETYLTSAKTLQNEYFDKWKWLSEKELELQKKELEYKKEIQKLKSDYESKNDELYSEKNSTRKLEELHKRELSGKDEMIKVQSENIKMLQTKVSEMNDNFIEIIKEMKPVIVQPEIVTLPSNRK
jgi:chromosome segregation ATPase